MTLYELDENSVYHGNTIEISEYDTWTSTYTPNPPPLEVFGKVRQCIDGMWYELDTAMVLPKPVPQSITKVQAMRAMKQTDVNTTNNTTMWNSFQALLASNTDANDEWILALDLQRNHPLVIALTPALGKTDAQIDELFILGATL